MSYSTCSHPQSINLCQLMKLKGSNSITHMSHACTASNVVSQRSVFTGVGTRSGGGSEECWMLGRHEARTAATRQLRKSLWSPSFMKARQQLWGFRLQVTSQRRQRENCKVEGTGVWQISDFVEMWRWERLPCCVSDRLDCSDQTSALRAQRLAVRLLSADLNSGLEK